MLFWTSVVFWKSEFSQRDQLIFEPNVFLVHKEQESSNIASGQPIVRDANKEKQTIILCNILSSYTKKSLNSRKTYHFYVHLCILWDKMVKSNLLIKLLIKLVQQFAELT